MCTHEIPEMMLCVHIKSGYDSRETICYDLKSAILSLHESARLIFHSLKFCVSQREIGFCFLKNQLQL